MPNYVKATWCGEDIAFSDSITANIADNAIISYIPSEWEAAKPKRIRCEYCGCLSEKDYGTCEHCGAAL